jgi:hypothetical protein
MRLRPSEDLAAAFAPVRRPASPEATGTDRGGTRARPYPPLPTSGAVATGRLQLCRRLLSLRSRPTIGTSSRLFCRMLFSGNASCREERPRSVSNDPHPVPRAGEEKTSPGLATHEDKIPLKESGSRLPPGCLPTPNARSGDIFRELQRRSPGRYQPLQIRTHEQRHAENTSLPGTETFEEQWQEEVIRGPSPQPVSVAAMPTRISCPPPIEQSSGLDFGVHHRFW